MPPEVTLHREYDHGSIYDYRETAVYVPSVTTDLVGFEFKSDEDAVRAADALHQDAPASVVVFEDDNRDALVRARLWASIHDRVDLDSPLDWREAMSDDCKRVRIPAVIAADGTATIAAYLASYGFDNSEIADAFDVASRTVSQYISDFKKGER